MAAECCSSLVANTNGRLAIPALAGLLVFTDIKHFAKDTMSAILFPVRRSTRINAESNCAD